MVALYSRLRLPLCVRVCFYVRACALTGTGGNSSETGAKATSRSPVDVLVPEPVVPHVDTGPSEGEAPLQRNEGEKHLLELYSKRENSNAHRFKAKTRASLWMDSSSKKLRFCHHFLNLIVFQASPKSPSKYRKSGPYNSIEVGAVNPRTALSQWVKLRIGLIHEQIFRHIPWTGYIDSLKRSNSKE